VTAGAGAQVRAAGTKRVDLVEEQHARTAHPGSLEDRMQVPFARPDPHIEHLVDPDSHEAGPDFPGGSAGQVSLAAPGRAVHEDAATDRLAVGPVQLRVAKWMDDLDPDLVFHLVHAADVGEGDRRPPSRVNRRDRGWIVPRHAVPVVGHQRLRLSGQR
jgi:hypothetical protein